MAQVNTIHGLIDDSELLRRDGLVDDEIEHTTSVEYCLLGCTGEAHKTGKPDAPGHFCSQHVHRSAHVMLKKPVAIEGVAASF